MNAPETVDLVRDLVNALPAHARNQLHITQLVQGMVHAAVRDHGWTVQQLARECSRDLAGVVNAGAVITHRLRHAAGHDPPAPVTRTGLRILPLCGSCTDGWIEHPDTRHPTARCPCRTKET